MRKIKTIILLCLSFAALYITCCSCCSAKYNQPLVGSSVRLPSAVPVAQDSATLFYTCFSGGGTRAMAMGYYAVDELAKVPYARYVVNADTVRTTLREEIDYTSGVSGGSFVSAALAVYPQSEWPAFYSRAVNKNIQGSIIERLLTVWNWPKLLSPYYNRTDLASEFYDRRVFQRKTFGDLPTHPVLYINTTLLANKSHFVFNDAYFQYIKSDIRSYPLGYACAASSAFPVGFAPMTLKNYNTTYLPESTMLRDKKYAAAVRNSAEDLDQHSFAELYRFTHDTTNKWLHVSDGGLAGNTGVERVLADWQTNGVINKALNDARQPLRRLIFVVVNAGTNPEDESCVKRRAPGVSKVLLYTMTTSMDLLSAERITQLRAKIEECWNTVQQAQGRDPALALLEKPYLIELSARHLKRDLAWEFNKLPTSFDLNPEQLATIQTAVRHLLVDNPEYIRLLESIQKDRR